MSIDALITKLKRIERAAQAGNIFAGDVMLILESSGRGAIIIEDWRNDETHAEFTFDDAMGLDVLIGGVIAGLEATE